MSVIPLRKPKPQPNQLSVELDLGRWGVVLWRDGRFAGRIICADRIEANLKADELQSKGLKRVKAGGRR